jgi:GNAT superfamily N-acetyltransferase
MAAERVTAQLEVLPAGAADERALVEELVDLVNAAYAAGEAGLWLEGTERTTRGEVAGLIRRGQTVVARLGSRLAGCACLRPRDVRTAELGFVCAAPDHWGSGLGRKLVRFAEELARSRGVETMQLELLVPRGWVHPDKDRLRAWYERLGYGAVRSAPFDEVATHAASQLTTPCEFLVFRKPLGGARVR